MEVEKAQFVEKILNTPTYLNYLGNPSQFELIILGMSTVLFVYLLKALFLSFISWKQSKFTAYLSAVLSEKMFYGYFLFH